jgi:DNA-binding MarR family transcriptional regulator
MKKPDLTKLKGIELFEIYTSQGDEYAQTIRTAYATIGDDLFALLERAEREQKRITLNTVLNDVDDPVLDVVIK